ncbi:MAG: flagellar hook-length control protein FliK [Desulfobacteraceae bacterium]|jgi:flagellar hook-length control protein FliK
MLANSFQDMLMIKTGAASLGKNMGKAMGASSDSQNLGNDFSAVLNSLMGKVSRSENIGEKNLMALMNIEEAPGQKTNNVIEALAAVLTGQQGAKSADLYVGPEGLDALGNLLEQAGFDGDKVKSFILEKKQSMENEDSTGVSLQTLLPAIGEFTKENDQGVVLDISALPYVRAALNSFGFTPEKVENILAASTDKNQGIDVDNLLAELAPYTTAKETFTDRFLDKGSIKAFGHTYIKTAKDDGFSGTQRTANGVGTIENNPGATVNSTLETILSEMGVASALKTSSSESLAPAPFIKGFDAETFDGAAKSTYLTNNMNTASSVQHIMAANLAMNDATIETVLNDAAKGELSIDQFAAKLNALAEGRGSNTEKQILTDGFAKVFGENVHGVKKNMVTEGAKTFTSVETIDPKNAELRFDTKSTTPTLFTEKAEGLFQGNLKGNEGENTWASENSAAAVDGKTGGNKQAGVLNPGVLRNVEGEKMVTDDSTIDNTSILIEKTAKEKPFLTTDDKGEMPVIPVKALAGSSVYGKTSEVTQTNVSEKNLPAYVTDQVAKQISKAIRNGESEIKFHIKPPDMGRMELSITHTANGLKISILAEHSTTRDMLMNQASDLKSILADQGIRLEKMDVGMSGDFGGQSMAQTRHDSDQSNKGRKQKDKPLFSMDPLSNESRENAMSNLMAAGRYTRGKLDLVA